MIQIEFDIPLAQARRLTPGGEILMSDPVKDAPPWWAFWRKPKVRHYLILELRDDSQGLERGSVHVRAVEVVPDGERS
jgi:hypothetical protein